MGSYKDLKVYHRAKANAITLYRESRAIKGSDNLAIRSQLTRAAFSISSNIVEGSKADTAAQFAHFVGISIGSAWELGDHLDTVEDLELMASAKIDPARRANIEVRKMLDGLQKYLLALAEAELARKLNQQNRSKR